MLYSFDIAFVPANLPLNGKRDISNPRWVRATVEEETVTSAALLAAQMVGVHGMVTDILYRE